MFKGHGRSASTSSIRTLPKLPPNQGSSASSPAHAVTRAQAKGRRDAHAGGRHQIEGGEAIEPGFAAPELEPRTAALVLPSICTDLQLDVI